MLRDKIEMLKSQPLHIKIALVSLVVGVLVTLSVLTVRSFEPEEVFVQEAGPGKVQKPEHVRGIHLSSWVAGSKKARVRIQKLLDDTELNSVVIAIKEFQGEVYIPGVPLAEKYHTHVNAIPDIRDYLSELKEKGVYTIARIVVFKDTAMARKNPDIAVKRADGSVWTDRKGYSWLDPYDKSAWEYNLSIASRAVALGFDEIQFDYIRFPSDGDIKACRYSYAAHNSSSSARALDQFLDLAEKRLKPLGANISIDIFGLTPSVEHDMGIGQKITQMTEYVDYVSPMVYPSHYAKGEYGIPDPNVEPYRVVHRTMSDAKKRLGDRFSRLRPYLQDFSLGHKYGPQEVRAQIQACEDLGVTEWLLWDPSCQYTRLALRSRDGKLPEAAVFPKSWIPVPKEPKENTGANAKPENGKPEPKKTTAAPK